LFFVFFFFFFFDCIFDFYSFLFFWLFFLLNSLVCPLVPYLLFSFFSLSRVLESFFFIIAIKKGEKKEIKIGRLTKVIQYSVFKAWTTGSLIPFDTHASVPKCQITLENCFRLRMTPLYSQISLLHRRFTNRRVNSSKEKT